MPITFQCQNCKVIINLTHEEKQAVCGNCQSLCNVPTTIEPGVVIDDYLIVKLLGKGGKGHVYLAHELTLKRDVALKVILQSFKDDPVEKELLLKEARSVASLNHPNIVHAHKFGEYQGTLYFVMELVDGCTLNDVIKEKGIIEESEIYSIALDMAKALKHAWEKCELVHSDIKPDNIMISKDGTAKLTDLGLSKHHSETEATDDNIISGTPQYIAPEQILGDMLDFRSDFYSLGATLFHAVTGQFLFRATNIQEMVKMHLSSEPKRAYELNPKISKKFGDIIHRLVAKQKEDRFQSCDALITALTKCQERLTQKDDKKVHFVKNKNNQPNLKKKRKKKSPVPYILIAIIALALFGFYNFSQSYKKEISSNTKKESTFKKNLLVSYTFKKETDSKILKNESKIGKASNGRIYGAGWADGLTKETQSLLFKSNKDYVQVSLPDIVKSFTLTAWVKVKDLSNDFNSIISSDEFFRKGSVHWQIVKKGNITMGIYSGSKYNGFDFDSKFTKTDFNKWKFLAASYDAEKGYLSLFIDGEFKERKIIPKIIPIQVYEAQIGNWKKGERHFGGQIGQLNFYNKSLDYKEIKEAFSNIPTEIP